MTRQLLTAYMGAMLNQNEHLTKALIPDFPVGCRRITPGLGYLKALNQENVQVITDNIKEISAKGLILENGEFIEVDAIVCATGFDLSFVPRFPIIGENGNLQDIWKKNLPSAYMSCMVASMPNYFSQFLHSVLVILLLTIVKLFLDPTLPSAMAASSQLVSTKQNTSQK